MNNIPVILDINNPSAGYIPQFSPTVGDSNLCALNITLNNNGVPFDLTALTAKISLGRVDGTSTFADMTIVNATTGQISYTLQTADIAVSGNVNAEVVIYSSNGRLTSVTFSFAVKKGILDESSVESSNNFSALTTALNSVNQYDSRLNQLKVKQSFTATTNGTTTIPLNAANIDLAQCTIDAFLEGCLLDEPDHYTLNASAKTLTLNGWSLDSGEKIEYRIYM
ncbi:MAG: BppU family phage baseplate upper protein [Clostridium sp.]|uniref:BppU family phage baseplate upper protein n=1 Tax=Clostridium sp. TaxID=1506 RepID=UPI0039E747E6